MYRESKAADGEHTVVNTGIWIEKPVSEVLYSHLNIPAGDLRFAVTGKCNMNCYYCHREGCSAENELPFADIMRIIERSMVYGVRAVRLTGGEPLLHGEVTRICRELKGRFPGVKLGINTNAILIDKLLEIVNEGLIDCVVVGIDRYDAPISKASAVGRPSDEILGNVLKIKKAGCDANISAVYTGDLGNIEGLAEWCFRNRIKIKVLEVVDSEVADAPTEAYQRMVNHMIEKYGLSVFYNHTKKQYSAKSHDGKAISFFHSHCRLRECEVCARLHLRVSCDGDALTCLHPGTPKFSLLDESAFEGNILAALHNLGSPPERCEGKK